MKIALLCNESAGQVDAIREATACLAGAINQSTASQAFVWTRRANGAWGIDRLRDLDAIALQYNPFMYGPRGFAPWLPRLLGRVRRSSPRPLVGLVVHEPYVAMDRWRHRVIGPYQRLQLWLLGSIADTIYASIEVWTAALARRHPGKPCLHLPMGSTIPAISASTMLLRRQLSIPQDAMVLAALGTRHPSRHLDWISAAANALARSGRHVLVLNLGAGTPALPDLDADVDERRPGTLPADSLASHLATADIFLAPYVDGVSTRRTSLMAALQQGVAVVGTNGQLTDTAFRRASDAARLVSVEAGTAFVDAVVELAGDGDARSRLGAAGARLYEQAFTWSVGASRLLDGLRRARPTTKQPADMEARPRAS